MKPGIRIKIWTLLLLSGILTMGGTTFAYGQDSLLPVSPPEILAANEESGSNNAGEMQNANEDPVQEETAKIQPEPEAEKRPGGEDRQPAAPGS